MRTLRHSRLLGPLLAAAIAVAFTAGGLSGKVHALDQVHAICADHGEVIHLDEVARGHVAEVPGALQRAPANDHAGEHDHCQPPMTQRELVDRAADAAGSEAPDTAPATLRHDGDGAATLALYRLAPKTSPPISAS